MQNTVEKWYCPEKEVIIMITWTVENGYYEELIRWKSGQERRTYSLKRELLIPYEQSWPTTKRYYTTGLGGELDEVYMEKVNAVEERVFGEGDYVVMGVIEKKNWVSDLWALLTKVK